MIEGHQKNNIILNKLTMIVTIIITSSAEGIVLPAFIVKCCQSLIWVSKNFHKRCVEKQINYDGKAKITN